MPSLVIDTDTASDDAVALLIAARTPDVSIRLVTTVAGNVPLPLATRNALVTLELAGAGHVPVHSGRSQPLLRRLDTAQDVHGNNGMGGVEFPDPIASAVDDRAVEALLAVARDEPGQHVLVTLGPLSNIACAVLLDPDFLTRFTAVYCMAGAFDGVGNVNVMGEYNVWADPEAAAIVVDAPGNKVMVGWDVSRRYAVMRPDDSAALKAAGPLGEFVVAINRNVEEFCHTVTGLAGYDLPDPICIAAAIDPSLILRQSAHHVTIGRDDIARGASIVDQRFDAPAPNVDIAWHVDEDGFKAMLLAACRQG